MYKPKHDMPSLWTNSYGGYCGVVYFAYLEDINSKFENGTLDSCSAPDTTCTRHTGLEANSHCEYHILRLETLAITNGLH